jgi:hypothetical protein
MSMLLGLALTTTSAHAEVVRYALVVGANDGGLELEMLRYAEEDAGELRDVLDELGGFESQDIDYLAQPEVADLKARLAVMSEIIDKEDETLFLFYYSGHADARGLRLGDEIYTYADLRSDIDGMNADVTLGILDACRSGAVTNVKGAQVVDPFLGERLDAEGYAWITASSEDEQAQESDHIEGSFFTHYLVAGMRGAADNGDGSVSLQEAYSYAYEHTVTRTGATDGGTQHPEYEFQLQGKGDLELTSLNRATNKVILPRELNGTIMVLREDDGVFVAEVNKIHGQEMALALQPGSYRFRRREGGLIYEARLTVSANAIWVLGPDRWSDGRPEETTWKGVDEPVVVDDTGPDSLTEVADHITARSKDITAKTVGAAQNKDWRQSSALATGFSTLTPGAGQLYNGETGKGVFFVGTTYSTLAAASFAHKSATDSGLGTPGITLLTMTNEGLAFNGSLTGPSPITLVGWGLYGWSISQAYYFHNAQVDHRPRMGVTVGSETAWSDSFWTPDTAGIAADLMLGNGLSVGLDRTGVTTGTYGGETVRVFNMGGRVMVGYDQWEHLRPSVFVASGFRAGQTDEDEQAVRMVIGAGGNVRYYLTPRYYVSYEARYEIDGGQGDFVQGGGVGIHFGG